VDQDCIKLITYFSGHWIRSISAHAAAAGLHDTRGIPASILLRGADGYSLRQHFPGRPAASRHPERVLAVAETVATGGQPETEAMLDRVLSPGGARLVTAGHARLLSEEIDPVGLWDDVDEATRLTLYLGRQDRVYQVPAFEVICELLHRRGAAGATVLAGIDGTLRSHDGPEPRPAGRTAPAPMMIVAIGSGARLGLVLPEIGDLLRRPLMTLEQVHLCKRDGQIISLPQPTPQPGAAGRPLWQKLAVYAREPVRPGGRSVHRAIIGRLRAAGIGATTLHGVWGFRGEHAPHGGRHVPGITTVVGSAERIQEAFAVINELTGSRGLVTCETVTVIRGGCRAP
jgi:PII-like signaling protein